MKKNLYSLTLSDEVVREVDALAHRLGTNRSALVNRILSEYVSVPTPERRINDIFEAIEALVSPSRELVPFFAPNSQSMSLKSSLAYKYRPTVKYEVDLGGGEDTLGTLNVVFRTQSAELIAALTDFFRLWARIENVSRRRSAARSPVRSTTGASSVRSPCRADTPARRRTSPAPSAPMCSSSTACSRAI